MTGINVAAASRRSISRDWTVINTNTPSASLLTTRREFLKNSNTAGAGAALAATLAAPRAGYCAEATAIKGRMAVESGKLITWEEALNSNSQLAPDLEEISSLAAAAPAQPDASGNYPIAMTGRTQVL